MFGEFVDTCLCSISIFYFGVTFANAINKSWYFAWLAKEDRASTRNIPELLEGNAHLDFVPAVYRVTTR